MLLPSFLVWWERRDTEAVGHRNTENGSKPITLRQILYCMRCMPSSSMLQFNTLHLRCFMPVTSRRTGWVWRYLSGSTMPASYRQRRLRSLPHGQIPIRHQHNSQISQTEQGAFCQEYISEWMLPYITNPMLMSQFDVATPNRHFCRIYFIYCS